MLSSLKARWIAALTSGEYKQGMAALAIAHDDGSRTYCCLGVLCDLLVEDGILTKEERKGYSEAIYRTVVVSSAWPMCSTDVIPAGVAEQIGVSRRGEVPGLYDREGDLVELVTMNDSLGLSFSQIAQVVDLFMPEEESTAA